MESFSNIASRNDLADYIQVPIQKLTYLLYKKKTENLYEIFYIPKKSGGDREIKAPTADLKKVQKKLAKSLSEYQQQIARNEKIEMQVSHGFQKNKSIITNATIHKRKRIIINMDIENFFDTFHFGRVKGFFEKNKYFKLPTKVAVVIAQIVCYQGCLPQGAPTSPIIANLIFQIVDNRILKIAKKYKVNYTRYADDMTFSTNDKTFLLNQDNFIDEISKELKKSGFNINQSKTRISYKNSRQEVTGLTVNEKVNVKRDFYKKTRAMANSLYKTNSFVYNGVEGTLEQLEGRFSFIDQIDKYNNIFDKKKKHNYRYLNNRERDYQKFLFFKYFFAPNKPTIVTEGKTDIIYLKAALKKMYKDFPELITKVDNDKFEFKVSFLQRTKRLEYFFGMSTTGADALANLYKYFTDFERNDSAIPNYTEYFKRKMKKSPSNPILFVFDNELYSDDAKKPLRTFVNKVKLDESEKEILNSKYYLKIKNTSNLYLLVNPLVNNKNECEIEDLFDESTLGLVKNGKSFSREKKIDINKYFGKDIFSKHIYKNYKSIDFSNFKTFLEAINNSINVYKQENNG